MANFAAIPWPQAFIFIQVLVRAIDISYLGRL